MNTLARVLLAALAAMPATVTAQTTVAPSDASKDVHAAWLREVLDLDIGGAVASYQQVARDRTSHPERWIAIARLAELERAGTRVVPKPVFGDAPPALQKAFATLTPFPVDDLLRHASGDPASLLQAIGTESGRMPALRPATALVREWARGQGLSARDRLNARDRIERPSRPPQPGPNQDLKPWYAADILRDELEGRQEAAANKRSIFFADWKAPVTNGDAPALLARVRGNIDTWSNEKGTSQNRRAQLQRLRDAIDQRAATDPAAAIAFVARLPLYAERLLAEPPASSK